MYAIVDSCNNVIAIHDDERVILNFLGMNFKRFHKLYKVNKIPKKYREYYSEQYSNLYLIRYGDGYTQYENLEYLGFFNDKDLEYQLNITLDMLYKILEVSDLSEKKRSHIEKTIEIVSEIANDKVVPSDEELSYVKRNYNNGIVI